MVTDLVMKTNIMLKNQATDSKEELRSIRMRTKKGIEIIVTVSNGFTLVVLQDCTGVADVKPKEVKEGTEEGK